MYLRGGGLNRNVQFFFLNRDVGATVFVLS